jgi:hypothetical protein
MSKTRRSNPPARQTRWSDTQQRKDFDRILLMWSAWKNEHIGDFLEIEEAADGIDAALEVLDELMIGRIIRDE